ncbi:terminase [Leisingera sp. ANG-M1]|uniref:terminase large subunit domain-containing protein n=1 Tax=Leisingera sp. ANG-M1 TaxID=1577895 RepID=UPI000580AE7B|nr:terminase family protein [Leisingera sp. ANG-M1]KIC12869.1 terminase [Leisingera sp. ANG-M1]
MSHDLTVSAPQGIFLSGLNTKFRAYVGGFGSGKTYVGCLDLGLFAGRHPKTVQGYFAPTYRDIRDTFWPTMDEAAFTLGFSTRIKTSDKEVELYRGRAYYGTTICRSMDDPGGIVGFKIARALVDEIDILSKDKAQAAWRKIIARMRLVIPGVVNGIGVTTTPEGFRFVYDSFKRDPKSNYSMVQASTHENADFLPPDYISTLLEDYPEELIKAYLMGDFVNLTSGTVYRSYDRQRHQSTENIQPREPLHIGQDFNVGNMASVIFVQRGDNWHAVDELQGLQDTPHLIQVLTDRYEGHHITVYPDASGGSRKTVNASTSDIELLRQAGFSIRAPEANPPVKDRILAVNTAFEKGRLFVNALRCKAYAEALEQQAYDNNGEPDKSGGHDHHPDAGGYFVHQRMPVVKPTFKVQELRL